MTCRDKLSSCTTPTAQREGSPVSEEIDKREETAEKALRFVGGDTPIPPSAEWTRLADGAKATWTVTT
jgi:hypothetical protein